MNRPKNFKLNKLCQYSLVAICCAGTTAAFAEETIEQRLQKLEKQLAEHKEKKSGFHILNKVRFAGLVHMNGRVYDYNVGRFLGVDPFLQFPENSQSANPYSYIMNNPMSGTDPTGYSTQDEVDVINGGVVAKVQQEEKAGLENGQQNEKVKVRVKDSRSASKTGTIAAVFSRAVAGTGGTTSITINTNGLVNIGAKVIGIAKDFVKAIPGGFGLAAALHSPKVADGTFPDNWVQMGDGSGETGKNSLPNIRNNEQSLTGGPGGDPNNQNGDEDRPKGVPKDWIKQSARKKGHTKWVNPRNPHDYVRVKRNGEITQVRDGKAFDSKGNKVPLRSAESHGITADKFIFRK